MNKKLNTIMLVEDEPDIQEVAKLSLETFGKFKVHICSNGKEAIASVSSVKPDLIMLDVMMPGMDGLSTLKKLKENMDFEQIPVIFMTAKAQANEIKNYLDSGAIGAITKPFDPTKLVDQIFAIWKSKYE